MAQHTHGPQAAIAASEKDWPGKYFAFPRRKDDATLSAVDITVSFGYLDRSVILAIARFP